MTTHNKKRNTAFLFEVLILEQTKSILQKKDKRARFIESVINKFFNGTNLQRELDLYHALSESTEMQENIAEQLISNAKKEREKINDQTLFEEQTKLISLINKALGSDVFSNFVENYKNLASINIIFNKNAPLKLRTEVEEVIKESLIKKEKKDSLIKENINFLHYKKFLENFNDEYKELLPEQKELLNKYILFKFGDTVDFKIYLNNECLRLLSDIEKKKEVVKEHAELYNVVNQCLNELKSSNIRHLDDVFVYKIMKYQALDRELSNG
jgi:hypothetical protein